jgi:hypothetical protein
MMDRLVLNDAVWERMAPLIIGRPDQKGSTVSVAPRPFGLFVRSLESTVRRVIFWKGAHNGRPF